MSELKRLLDDDGDAFERELLSAAVDDPDEATRAERLVVALGLDGPVGPGGGGHGGDGGAATQTTGAVAAKVAAGAAVAGVVIWGALALRSGPAPERQPAVAPSAPVVTVSAAPVRTPPLVASSAATPVESAPKPAAPVRPQASAPRQQKKPEATAVSNASQLAREVRALDRVRSALRAGDAVRAKSELSAYYAAFPNGILAPEARGLGQRIEKSTAAGHNP